MTDRLTALLDRFRLQARVFHSGTLCNTADFDASDGAGHLHVLRGGRLRVGDGVAGERSLDQPSLLFYARPTPHWIRGEDTGADLVCASVRLGADMGNPLARSLPQVLVLPLADSPALDSVLGLLFDEAFAGYCGRQAALDRLSELLILHLLRHCMQAGLADGGVLAGLADPRLMKALTALHARPEAPWTLAGLAQTAGMSRARFAPHFRAVVGCTPGDYLTEWRLSVAKTLLRAGKPVKTVALEVGYGNASALARAFAAHHAGCSPTQWLASQGEMPGAAV